MNVAADMAVQCHACAATLRVRWVLLAVAGASSLLLLAAAGVSLEVLTTTGVYTALHLVEHCSSRFFGSCIMLVAACMSAAFTCAAFLSLLSVGGVRGRGLGSVRAAFFWGRV